MCGTKGGCATNVVVNTLLVVGGLNWGLTGVGMLMMQNWNVVNMLLGGMPTIEAVVYVLVGLAALMKLIGCKCAKCKACVCGVNPTATPTPGNM
jgi:uncharacterized membrane protein YuzA (DUF378 family)